MSLSVNQIQVADRDQISVLVVDDVLPIVEEMLTLLELKNIPATATYSLEGALQALVEYPNISVVICDVRLGEDSGFDLIELTKANRSIYDRDLEYVFVTGDPMGLRDFPNLDLTIMTKPVRPRELLSLIDKLLEKGS